MTALPSYMYRDPSEVVDTMRSCEGCKHRQAAFGSVVCVRKPNIPAIELRRCGRFKSNRGKGK